MAQHGGSVYPKVGFPGKTMHQPDPSAISLVGTCGLRRLGKSIAMDRAGPGGYVLAFHILGFPAWNQSPGCGTFAWLGAFMQAVQRFGLIGNTFLTPSCRRDVDYCRIIGVPLSRRVTKIARTGNCSVHPIRASR